MPQLSQQSIIMAAWTTSEQIEEVKGKLHLKERDAKAFYESSETKKIEFEQLIAKLRAENKTMRVNLSKSINGDEKVIRSVFQNRRHDLLSMQRFTVAEAINTMDQKVCEARKSLNALLYKRNQREERLSELRVTLKPHKKIHSADYNIDTEREIRRLQNEMDKARIKFEAARNIARRYEEIMMHMQEVCRNYPARLDLLEEIVGDATRELTVLHQMNEKAIRTSEEARKDLHLMEREMYQAKRARDTQLNETRKEVERRKEPSERTEKRAKVNIVSDGNDSRAIKLQQEKEDRQERILTLEDGFERIKNAINVSDIEEVVLRVINQEDTMARIKQQEEEKLTAKSLALAKKEQLKTEFENIKFTSQRLLAQGRKIEQEMRDKLAEKEVEKDTSVADMNIKERLLLDLQSGIATLYEKLKNIKLKPPFHNFSKNEPVADLANCARKLDVLLTELGLKKDMEGTGPKVDEHKLHAYLESRLPPENLRIKVDQDDDSDDDEFHFDHDQDNDGLLSRDEIKRMGQDLLNSKLKPKKKKSRKSRNS